MKEIKTKKGLTELLNRYEKAKADPEWILTIKGCIKSGLAMDEIDYKNTPKKLKSLWRGLK